MAHDINFYTRKKGLPGKVLEATLEGFKAQGIRLNVLNEKKYIPSDIAVVFGLHKKASKSGRIRKKIYNGQAETGGRVLVLERGFIRRDIYHSAGWGGICGRANFMNEKSNGKRVKALNVKMKEWRRNGDNILVCGQVPWDSNVQHLNYGKAGRNTRCCQGYLMWVKNTIEYLQARTKRPIIFRPHPVFNSKKWYVGIINDKVRWSEATLDEELSNAWACVLFSSNSGVDAVVNGVPALPQDKGSMIYTLGNVGMRALKRIEKPIYPSRKQWLKNLSYSQWTLEEMSKGIHLEHLNVR